MITSGVMQLLHSAIQIYDKRCGKEYLIAFGSKTRNDYKFVQIRIKQSSFWHLLGCQLEPDTSEGKNSTYIKCKNAEDVSEKITSIHGFSEIKEKFSAILNIFDFVEKAREIKIGYAVNCPKEYIFQIGSGNETGIIGYDVPNNGLKDFLLPKSAQLKPLSKISRTTFRIFLILSKDIGAKYYNKIEYEIQNGVYDKIKEHLPDEINIF